MEKIPVNVVVSAEEKQRILAQEGTWTAGRLILLGAITLGAAMSLLYYLAYLPV